MRSYLSFVCVLVLATPGEPTRAGEPPAAAKSKIPDPARVDEIAKMLPARQRGVGPTIDDREAWGNVAAAPQFSGAIPAAERLLKEPIPELTDELFLDFSKTGNRTRCQAVMGHRHGRIPTLALAECIENKGRFLAAIEEAIAALCSEKTWVMPAHDRSLENFEGRTVEIDLAVAGLSWNLATADYWLGEKLSEKTRKLVRDELERRTFRPFEGMVTTGKPRMWWPTCTSNWNAVCLAGVNGAAQAMIEAPRRRAFFVASTEHYVQNFLQGFTPDGYCSEGVGYWNYGFGHYTMLAETIHQATGGKLDLFADPRVEKDALFAPRMEIVPGIYPAFADCGVGSRPGTPLEAFLSRRFGWKLAVEREGLLLDIGRVGSLFEFGLFGFPNSATAAPPKSGASLDPLKSLRDWFSDAGILICRHSSASERPFGAALKGGHNAEHHNHNDVGSYLVAVGRSTPLVDPGAEVYTARTFSGNRYESGVLNSFGHPVPRIAGKLQRPGREAAAKVVDTEFTDKADTLVLDLRAAYPVPDLAKLVRTFVFSREGHGSLTVIDEVELTKPQTFGTALVTMSDWKELSPGLLRVGDGAEAVDVAIAADGAKFRIEPVEIKEDLGGRRLPVRLGIELAAPVARATVTMKITPHRQSATMP